MPEVELSGKSSDSRKIAQRTILAGATWVSCSRGTFPRNAVGWENELGTFLIARALHKPSFWDSHLFSPANFTCTAQNYSVFLSHEGKLQHVEKYEILSAAPGSLAWLPTSGGQLNFENAVVGGWTKQGEMIYIGRAKLHDPTSSTTFWLPGKIQGGFCTISWKGKEIQRINYDILLGLPGSGPENLVEGATIAKVMYSSDETFCKKIVGKYTSTIFFAFLTLLSLSCAFELWRQHDEMTKIHDISRFLEQAPEALTKF